MIVFVAIISTAGHIPTVTDTLVHTRTVGPAPVSLPRAMRLSRARRSRPLRDHIRRIVLSAHLCATVATLFVHAGWSCLRARTRGLAQHDV
jgi:hypothetical protein